MQSVDSREKITVLILLAASTVLAHDPGRTTGMVNTAAPSGHLLLAAALAGGLIAVLMLLSPGKSHRSLRTTLKDTWPSLLGLAALTAGYALIVQPLGFFIATALFLTAGAVLLGERRWGPLLLLSLPAAAALELALHGVFGLSINDPLMHALGLIA